MPTKWSFNQLKLSSKMLIGSAVPLVLFSILAIMSFFAVRSLDNTSRWVEHTYVVLANAAQIEKLVVDLETGQRGFIITGKEIFLDPFNAGKLTLATTLRETKKLVSDNPAQVKRLDAIERLINQWYEKAGHVEINARRQVGVGAKDASYLQQVLAQGTGKGILDEMRILLDQLDAAFTRANNQHARLQVVLIAKAMVDQETGQRGFLITGKNNFLEPYRHGQIALKKHISTLSDVIDRAYNREIMLNDVKHLALMEKRWEKEVASKEIALRKNIMSRELALKALKASGLDERGKAIFDEMRIILDRMNKAFALSKNSDGEKLVLRLSKSLVDQETGLRGYLLTGQNNFLAPYAQGKNQFLEGVGELEVLIGNAYNIHKTRRMVAEIGNNAQEWLTRAAKPEIAIRVEINKVTTSMADVIKLIESETGKNIIDQLREEIQIFSGIEKDLMKQRQLESSHSVIIFDWLLIIGTLVIILVSIFLSFIIIRIIESQLKNTAKIANTVAAGNYEVDVSVQNENDYLGKALQKMTASLKQYTQELSAEKNKLQAQDWVKSNQSMLINKLQKVKDLPKFAEVLMNELVPVLDAHLGVFYFRETQDQGKKAVFSLLGSYAYKKRKDLSSQFNLGEGLVGQCALEKKTILLTEAPDNYIEINSGSGKGAPRNIIVVPVVFEMEAIAVIEIASVSQFSDDQLTMLDLVAASMGVMINNIISQEQTKGLLDESQELSKELQSQQEELKASNEELEEKTQVLKESEEELKAQSEELQAANEELEEKSERLEMQNADIAKKNEEVEEARLEVEQRAKDLALASKYKSEFLANMSHELRTPLNSLLILSKDLEANKTGNLTERQIEAAKVIHDGGEDLLILINDILDLSKVEAGKLQVDIASVNVQDFLNSMKMKMGPIVQQKGISFDLDMTTNVTATFDTDEQRLAQIIKNLCYNAIKFTETGGVTIRASAPSADIIAFAVIDTGIGIAKDKQREIFEAFQQGDGSTSRTYGGTGLGLAISRAMSELLGGELILESEQGKGSTFTLLLPLHAVDLTEKQEVPEKNKDDSPMFEIKSTDQAMVREAFLPDDRDSFIDNEKSVLIIEDDKIFASVLMEVAKEKGYQYLSAGDGQSGLALAKEYSPSGIVLDLGLPDMDGLQILEQLKFDLSTRHIPIHIVSAREETPEYKQKGAIGYLLKTGDRGDLDSIFQKIESINEGTVKNVLVVEDDPQSQLAIATLIDSENITLDKALSSTEARDKLTNNRYDCMILDLNLPDISGFDLLKELKREKVTMPPVVVYTGKELTQEEHIELQQFTTSIVVKGAESSERLLDELSLFLHSVAAELPHKDKKVVQMLHNSEKMLQNRRILLVDDDVRNIFALSSALEDCGLDVFVASNGKVALDKLHSEDNMELVIMDIMMPVMDGYEAMREIRKQEAYKDLPIIALTAKAMTGDREKCIEAGASDYITKPIDVDKLLSMMKVWLFK